MIERKPRAPVLRARALRAIAAGARELAHLGGPQLRFVLGAAHALGVDRWLDALLRSGEFDAASLDVLLLEVARYDASQASMPTTAQADRTLQEEGTLKLHQLWFLKHRDAAQEQERVQAAVALLGQAG